MPADVELKWTSGPKRSKAKQIPDDVWKGYESEIREMYTSMTLDELAAEMKRIHGFEATLRQYTARLERWGLKKYKTKNTALESMAEGSRDDTNLENFSTANAEGSKRGRTAPNPDDSDTQNSGYSPSGTPSAKKPKMDDGQAELHQPQFSILSEPENGNAPMTSGADVFTYRNQSSFPGFLLNGQGCILSEATVRAVLHDCNFLHPFSVSGIDVESCLRISRLIRDLQQPYQGFQLTLQTENYLKVIADYLFVTERFAEATHLYSIVSVSEGYQRSFTTFFDTPSLISAARAARSKRDCQSIRRILEETVKHHSGGMRSSPDRFLAHILLANLSSRLGLSSETRVDLRGARYCATSRESMGHSVNDSSLDLLVYVYHTWLHHSPTFGLILDEYPKPRQGKSSISYEGFAQSFPKQHTKFHTRTENIVQDIKASLHWCQAANTWLRHSTKIGTNTYDQPGTFPSLWRMWHGGYSGSPKTPRWRTGLFIGISLAEHVNICAKVFPILEEAQHESWWMDRAITLYLQILYERIDTFQQLPWDIAKYGSVSNRDQIAPIMPSPMLFSDLVPTIAPSVESTNSSFLRLKEASAAMAFRQQGSSKPGTARSTPGMKYALYGSNPSMSFLSEVFARSCSVSVSSPHQGSDMQKSSALHVEMSLNDDEQEDLETEAVYRL